MKDWLKFVAGFLTVLILSSIVYVALPGKVKVRVDKDKTTLYVYNKQRHRWLVAGREFNSLWSFPRKLRRDLSSVKVWVERNGSDVYIYRWTRFLKGPAILDVYYFKGSVNDVKQFPIYHEVRVFNASGLVYQYEVRDLDYDGESVLLNSTCLTVKGVKIKWSDGFYYAKIFKTGVLKVRYRVSSDYFVLRNKLFDPVSLLINGEEADKDVEVGEVVNFTATGSGTVCISADHPDLGENFSCGSGSATYLWVARGGVRKFQDGSLAKNYSFTGSGCESFNLSSVRNGSEVLGAFINLHGFYTSSYPENVRVDVEGDGSYEFTSSGFLIGDKVFLNKTNSSASTVVLSFNDSVTQTIYLKLGKSVNVTLAKLNITPNFSGRVKHNVFQPFVKPSELTEPGIARQKYPNSESDKYWFFGGLARGSGWQSVSKSYVWRFETGLLSENVSLPYNAGRGVIVVWSPKTVGGYHGFIVCGGWDSINNYMRGNCYFRKVYPEPSTGYEWFTLSSLPETRAYAGVVAGGDVYGDGKVYGSSDLVYVFGGANFPDYATNTCWKYNVSSDSWSTCTNMPKEMGNLWCEWWNTTHIACFGGCGNAGWCPGVCNYIEVYDTVSDSWSEYDGVICPGSGLRINGRVFSIRGDTKKAYRLKNLSVWEEVDLDWQGDKNMAQYAVCDEFEGRGYCYSGVWDDGVFSYYDVLIHGFYFMPKDSFLQVDSFANLSWNESYDLLSEVEVSNFSREVNSFLSSCTPDNDGFCYLPLYFFSDGVGNLTIHDLVVEGVVNPVGLDWRVVNCSTNYCNVSLKVCSDSAGVVMVSGVNITFKGTCKVNVTACDDSSCEGRWVTVYHSRFNNSLPYSWTSAVFFLPLSNDDKNVSAFGQTDSVPVFNISGLAQDKAFNIALKIVGNFSSCVNLTASNTSSKSDGVLLSNSSWTQVCSLERNGSCGVWLWADLYDCNASVQKFLRFNVSVKSCCDTCDSCGW